MHCLTDRFHLSRVRDNVASGPILILFFTLAKAYT